MPSVTISNGARRHRRAVPLRTLRRTLRRAAGVAIAIALPAIGARAQGSVSGQLTILERPGVRTTDLSNGVVWLEPAGAPHPGPPASSAAQIVMESRQYVPRIRVVPIGSRVGFPNQDPFRHNVFSKSGPSEFDLGLFGRGETREARMDRSGVYPIFCNVHAKMVAFVVAVATPHVTQVSPDGRFTIRSVPAGAYRLRAWHDRGGEHAAELTVGAEGRGDISVQLDARGYRFVQHRNKFGQEYTTSGRDRY